MKHLRHIFLPFIVLVAVAASTVSCNTGDDEDTWKDYAEWRDINEQWIAEMEALRLPDGSPEYTRVVPVWNRNAYVLMKWFNDTMQTRDNLRPLYTSTVDVKYLGQRYDSTPFDSSYVATTYGDSIFRTKASAVITGWAIALERMHVGDSVQVIIPYEQGYGATPVGKQGTSNFLRPYSALQFFIKLVDIPAEYIRK